MDDDAPEVTMSVPVYVAADPAQGVPLPNAVQCPACWAIVLAPQLDDHRQAAHQ